MFRPSTRRFYLSNSLSNTVDVTSRVYGRSTDLPVTGNWNNSVGHDGTRVSVDVTITGMPVGTLIDGAFTAVAGDHLGSSSVVRDHHSKTRFQRYTPYGAIRDDSHRRNSLQVDETFTGQTHDPGTGLIDYNARHYDPQLGRFVMADTMLDGLNRYSYVGNNPLRYVDPSGYCMQELYDFCLDNLASGGAPESLGTKRLSPLTILSADDVQAVRSHLSMMQVGDPDAWAGSSASYYYAEHAFNAALYSGTIVDMGDGTFQLADCGNWCDSYWADSIADVLLEDPGGTFSAVLDVAIFSTAGRWPGHPSMAKAVAPTSAVDDVGLSNRGLVPAAGTRIRPAGVPDEWRIVPTRGDGGVRYYDPSNPGNSVRVMQGNPNSPFPNSQAPYVRWQRNSHPLDVNGNVLSTAQTTDAHIPLQDFVFRPEVFGP